MRLILVGFGTVGRGVAESLLASEPELLVAGAEPRVVAVVDPVVGSVRHEGGLDLGTLLKLADTGESLASYPGAKPAADLKEANSKLDAATQPLAELMMDRVMAEMLEKRGVLPG